MARPTVFIPVFPGTNCEYDSAKAFKRAGADVITRVFKNQSAQDIRDSVEAYEKDIAKAQIIMFPGGFSAGDEPDGSAKFFATAFRNLRRIQSLSSKIAVTPFASRQPDRCPDHPTGCLPDACQCLEWVGRN